MHVSVLNGKQKFRLILRCPQYKAQQSKSCALWQRVAKAVIQCIERIKKSMMREHSPLPLSIPPCSYDIRVAIAVCVEDFEPQVPTLVQERRVCNRFS